MRICKSILATSHADCQIEKMAKQIPNYLFGLVEDDGDCGVGGQAEDEDKSEVDAGEVVHTVRQVPLLTENQTRDGTCSNLTNVVVEFCKMLLVFSISSEKHCCISFFIFVDIFLEY